MKNQDSVITNAPALYRDKAQVISRQKQYRVMGLATFCVAVGLLAMRMLAYYLPITNDTVADVVFSLPLQLGILVAVPILFYRFALKKNFREIVDYSNIRKTKWFNLVLAVPIGICCHVVTIAVSSLWQGILISLGYTHSSSVMPETFSAGIFIVEILITGLLPAFCEEFFNRGGLLTTMRGSFPFTVTVIIMGVEFGLFHQYITQVFYTMLFGALMAFICLKTRSSLPCMIIHFVNNTFAVINDYCDEYGFANGGLYGLLNNVADSHPGLLLPMYFLAALALAGLVVLLLYLNSNKRLERKKDVIASSGYDHTHNRVVLIGEEDKDKVRELGLDKEVYGHKLDDDLYKPTLRDNAFFIGAIVTAALTTLFTFVFGWVV